MNRWQPSDVFILLIIILIMFISGFAVFSVYTGTPFEQGRAKAIGSLFDSLLAIIAMYLGSKLNEK